MIIWTQYLHVYKYWPHSFSYEHVFLLCGREYCAWYFNTICTSLVYTFCQKCKMNFFHFYNYLVIHLSIYRWADTHDIVCLWGSENNSWEPVPFFSHVYGFGSSSLAVPFLADPSTLPWTLFSWHSFQLF